MPRIFATYDASTDKDGHFVFERVVPGNARIGRRVWPTFSDGAKEAASCCMVPVAFAAGETSRLELGGTGQRVVATLEQPKAFNGKVNWNHITIFVRPYFAEPPNRDDLIPTAIRGNADKRAAWLREWEQTPLGQQWKALRAVYDANLQINSAGPYFTAASTGTAASTSTTCLPATSRSPSGLASTSRGSRGTGVVASPFPASKAVRPTCRWTWEF